MLTLNDLEVAHVRLAELCGEAERERLVALAAGPGHKRARRSWVKAAIRALDRGTRALGWERVERAGPGIGRVPERP